MNTGSRNQQKENWDWLSKDRKSGFGEQVNRSLKESEALSS